MTKQCVITRLTKERRGYLIEKTNFFIEREIATAHSANGRAGKGGIEFCYIIFSLPLGLGGKLKTI